MRTQSNPETESTITRQLWTYAEAVKALPYLHALVRALREHWLHRERARLQVRRLDGGPGPRDRQAPISRAEAIREAEVAEGSFNEARRELEALNVSCLDPVGGLALIPFREGDDRAWCVFDLFAVRGPESGSFTLTRWNSGGRPVEPLDPRLVDAVFSSRSCDGSIFRATRP